MGFFKYYIEHFLYVYRPILKKSTTDVDINVITKCKPTVLTARSSYIISSDFSLS